MRIFYMLGMVFLFFGCSAPKSPEEILTAARQKLKSAGQVQFRQDLIVEIPYMQEYDTSVRFSDFRRSSNAAFGYDFKGKGDGFEFWYLDGIQYSVDNLDSTVMVLEGSERIQHNSFRSFNPLFLLEKDPWNYIGDTTIQQKKLLKYQWVEMDTVIDDKKVYLKNHLWINPANLLPEFYSRSAYQDGSRSQLIESTFQDWNLEDTAKPFFEDFPKGYLTKVEGSTESPLLKVGDQAPEFELEDEDGNLIRLSDFRGKKVLLDFSIINCGWCKIALEKFAKDDYVFADDMVPLYINPEDSWEKLKKYQSSVKVPFPILADAKQVGKDYGVNGFPTFYVIDETGKIKEVHQGYSDEKILEWKRKPE